ncbi:histidine--tRNA ligase [Candidatus Woesearchaeota archaeon]|nr:histidine--tRNA ligase [Candidatus Woesearchaeota archaeon]
MKLMNARGTRDFAPEDKIVRQRLTDMLRKTFELYGFSPLETPVIERLDVLSAKYAGGAEILKETFSFQDQGRRELCLRYDLTVPMARFVGMNPTVKMPFKRYQIGQVFRDGPIKTGRYREFWQCDVDIVGSKSMLADAQCLQIAQKFFRTLELDVFIEVNSRKILDGMMEASGIPEDKRMPVIMEIDKLKKVGQDAVQKNIEALGIDKDPLMKLMEILTTDGSNEEKLNSLKPLLTSDTGKAGLEEIQELLSYLDNRNIVFNIALARGLSYYTGPVFEVFMEDGKLFSSSLAGGGRWDRMIQDFLQSKKEYPAVGISFGIEPITAVLNLLDKEDKTRLTVTKVYVIPIGTQKECIAIAEQLRAEGINTDMDIMGKGISKNLDYADKMGIPFVIFVGEDELKAGKFKLKDMESGEEQMLSIEDIISRLK